MTPATDAMVDIEATLARYGPAVDGQDEDLYHSIFMPDAVIDYTRILTTQTMTPAEQWSMLPKTGSGIESWKHLIYNPLIFLHGDSARAFSILRAESVRRDLETGAVTQHVLAGLYDDRLILTPQGWRIHHRVLHPKSAEGWNPGDDRERLERTSPGAPAADVRWAGNDSTSSSADPQAAEKMAVRQAFFRYSHGFDQLWWPLFHSAFTDDVVIDGSLCGLGEITPQDMQNMEVTFRHISTQHPVWNVSIEIDGDTARGVSDCAAHLSSLAEKGDGNVEREWRRGGYVDELRKQDGQWRISRRQLRVDYVDSAVVQYDQTVLDAIEKSRSDLEQDQIQGV